MAPADRCFPTFRGCWASPRGLNSLVGLFSPKLITEVAMGTLSSMPNSLLCWSWGQWEPWVGAVGCASSCVGGKVCPQNRWVSACGRAPCSSECAQQSAVLDLVLQGLGQGLETQQPY